MSVTPSAAPGEQVPPRAVRLLRARPLTSFFVLAYGVTWLLWSPVLLLGLPVFDPVTHAPTWYLMPAIAIGVTGSAFLMTAVTAGRAGVRRMVERLTAWRVGLRWFAVAVLLIPVTQVVFAALLGSPGALAAFTPAALAFYPLAWVSHFFFGPLFEESGWRGFALPRMQHRFGPTRGTLLLGLLWSAWHFFLYVPTWFAGGLVGGLVGIVVFTLTTTAMAFVFTWLSNGTGASLLLVILLHGSVDGTATYIQRLADPGVGILTPDDSSAVLMLGLLVGCLVLALAIGTATRGRLGYDRYRGGAERSDLDPPVDPAPRHAAA